MIVSIAAGRVRERDKGAWARRKKLTRHGLPFASHFGLQAARGGYWAFLLVLVLLPLEFSVWPVVPAFSGSGPGPPVGAILELFSLSDVPASVFALFALAVSVSELPPHPLQKIAVADKMRIARVRRILFPPVSGKVRIFKSGAQARTKDSPQRHRRHRENRSERDVYRSSCSLTS
jgi:hypothetical protein